jgi:glycosyltransferase involved in cell wall biosynthesis
VSPVRVSICIPTYDRLPYLREAVTAARAQTMSEIEVLIGDDGDSAELGAYCVAQGRDDPRVRYLKTPGRLRLAGNWNFLAEQARGDYVALIGDDDRLLPEFVERLLAAATNGAAVVFCNHYLIDATGQRLLEASLAATRHYGRAKLRPGPLADAQSCVWQNSVSMTASLVRTEHVRRLKFKHDINTPELELFVRLAAEGERFVFVDDYLAEYRTHAGSQTSQGLTIDRLAEYLLPVPVERHVEPVKRELMSDLLLSSVSLRLGRGDLGGARRLAGADYYPAAVSSARALIQHLTLALPDSVAPGAYRTLGRLSRWARRGKPGAS